MEACTTIKQDRLAELRQQIVDTLMEIDSITLQVNPRILANYARSVGYLENDLYKWQIKARRAKRKFALAQAAANKGEEISEQAIEDALDAEFAAWEVEIAARRNEQLKLMEKLAGSRPLSPKEARELKALHRKLIRRLHPDLHPNLPEEAHRFFLIAQNAYESGDLSMLIAVDTATLDYVDVDVMPESSEDEIEIDIAMAEAQQNIAVEKLDSLKASYPYVLSDLLDDPTALVKRREELEAEIMRQKDVCSYYEEKIADLKDGKER